MKKFVRLMIIAAAFSAPALADDAVPPPATAPGVQAPTAQGDGATETSYLDRVVCKKLPPPTGTMLGGRRICQTERQWREQMKRSQEDIIDTQQKGRGFGGPGG